MEASRAATGIEEVLQMIMVRSINEIGHLTGKRTIAEFAENPEIVDMLRSLGVDYAQTVSCYDPGANGEACGACDACQLRLKGFAENSATDPVKYRNA